MFQCPFLLVAAGRKMPNRFVERTGLIQCWAQLRFVSMTRFTTAGATSASSACAGGIMMLGKLVGLVVRRGTTLLDAVHI